MRENWKSIVNVMLLLVIVCVVLVQLFGPRDVPPDYWKGRAVVDKIESGKYALRYVGPLPTEQGHEQKAADTGQEKELAASAPDRNQTI